MEENEIRPNIYYKATRKGGVSIYDRHFIYHMGLNIHTAPDKGSTICSEGIHLAKNMADLCRLASGYEEVYECRAGVILAEDMEKIRVAYCFVDKQVEIPIDWSKVCPGIPSNPLCGMDWVKEHYNHFTQEDYDKLGITIKTDRREVTITAKNKLKDVRTVIGSLK